jgi:hypothetical protein
MMKPQLLPSCTAADIRGGIFFASCKATIIESQRALATHMNTNTNKLTIPDCPDSARFWSVACESSRFVFAFGCSCDGLHPTKGKSCMNRHGAFCTPPQIDTVRKGNATRKGMWPSSLLATFRHKMTHSQLPVSSFQSRTRS